MLDDENIEQCVSDKNAHVRTQVQFFDRNARYLKTMSLVATTTAECSAHVVGISAYFYRRFFIITLYVQWHKRFFKLTYFHCRLQSACYLCTADAGTIGVSSPAATNLSTMTFFSVIILLRA